MSLDVFQKPPDAGERLCRRSLQLLACLFHNREIRFRSTPDPVVPDATFFEMLLRGTGAQTGDEDEF